MTDLEKSVKFREFARRIRDLYNNAGNEDIFKEVIAFFKEWFSDNYSTVTEDQAKELAEVFYKIIVNLYNNYLLEKNASGEYVEDLIPALISWFDEVIGVDITQNEAAQAVYGRDPIVQFIDLLKLAASTQTLDEFQINLYEWFVLNADFPDSTTTTTAAPTTTTTAAPTTTITAAP